MANETKAQLVSEKNDRIPCMFNPASFKLTRSNKWHGEAVAGNPPPRVEFRGAESGTFSLQLFFDTTGTGSPVSDYTDRLEKLMEIDPSLPGYNEASSNGRPPWVRFLWGKWSTFPAVIMSLSVEFNYFSSTGLPLRATTDLSLKQFEPEIPTKKQNPTSGTPEPHRVHRVQPGETLDRIAAQHYGDSTKWRPIAAANGVEDPMTVRPGSFLAIPKLGA